MLNAHIIKKTNEIASLLLQTTSQYWIYNNKGRHFLSLTIHKFSTSYVIEGWGFDYKFEIHYVSIDFLM
jgi:hypothetical protein